jgi:ATP-dependent DNA ligase
LTRTGLDWTAQYPSAIAALANLKVKTAYIGGELCGVDDTGLPSFAQTQSATGERGVRLVYYAFDLLHLDGQDTSRHTNRINRRETLKESKGPRLTRWQGVQVGRIFYLNPL